MDLEVKEISNRRSKLEITLSVLKAIESGIDKPTRIMYSANMSWNPTQKVLERLVQEGHIQVTEEFGNKRAKKRYEITEKGRNVLRYFHGAEELINI